MKKITFVAIGLLLASTAWTQTLFQPSLEEAQAKARTESKKIIVDFYSYT